MKIPCTSCNQRLDIPEELAGHTIECPACNASLTVPDVTAITSLSPRAQVQEQIQTEASSKNSKSSKLKLAIVAVAGTAVVVIASIMFFSDMSVKTDGESKQSAPTPVTETAKPPTANLPNISIHEAAYKNDINAVKLYIKSGVDLNQIGKGKPWEDSKSFAPATPLFYAILGRNKEIIELLLSKGVDVNLENRNGSSPLVIAVKLNEPEIADLLRKHGAKKVVELNTKNPTISKMEGNMMIPYGMGNMPTMGMNPMMGMPGMGFGAPKDFDPKEIFKEEIEEINQRLVKGAPLNQYNDQGDTELMVAARANDLDLAKRLLEKKANPNLKVNLEEDDFGAGETALHIAAKAEHKAMCELLYKNGALLNVKDEMGFTPLDSILSNFEPKMNPIDPFSGKKVKPKMTRKGRETIAYLRGKGGKNMTVKEREAVMATNDPFQHMMGMNPLMMGGMDDFTKQLQKIESYGLGPNDSPEGFNEEINKINQMIFKMMPFATSEPEAPTVKLSNISIINAAMNGNIETTKKAISDGADVNSKDEFGFTALHYTAWYGQKKIVELLIAKGADVNAKVLSGAKKGSTPLDLNFINIEISKSEGGSGSKIYTETADLLRKHGGKTAEELKAEGK